MTHIPTFIGSLFGGFRVFFSVWQLCIMQFSPFYIAYFLTVYFLLTQKKSEWSGLTTMLVTALGLALGFSILFAVLSVPGLFGASVIRGIRGLRFASGVFILSAGALMIVLAALSSFSSRAMVPAVLSPLVGASFAIAYSPCIPPELSAILNYSGMPGNSYRGLFFLFGYASGVCAAATLTGAVIVLFIRFGRGRSKAPASLAPPVISSLVFMIIGLLLVLGLMLRYKMFLVNIV